ncbi:MAG: hypothetical protein EPO39_13575 [Candidatus Manganitrophaceae bacterium]|nr:MAG: hypothetical protein EPO39_13575 [Candidatus Manganitrophaceae bacterium]
MPFFILFFIIAALPVEGWSQTSDFFSNTQGIDRLSTGSTGSCPNCPGFNPDRLIRHSGIDPDGSGPISFSQSISTTAPSLGGTVEGPFFNLLGPGAVTDNMFGMISRAGADPAKCGIDVTGAGTLPTSTGLNCGDIRFNRTSQLVTVPNTPGTEGLTSLVTQPAVFSGDFFPSTDDHLGINLTHTFIRSRTTAPLQSGDLSVTCAPGAFTCLGSREQLRQITPMMIGAAGTLDSPGAGENRFVQTFEWHSSSNAGDSFTAPTVQWSLELNDSIRETDQQPGMQSGLLSGTFNYNTPGNFPSLAIPFVRSSTDLCRGVAGTEGTCIVIPQ